MKTFKNLTIAKKLWLLMVVVGIGIGLLATAFLVSERKLLMEDRQAAVRQAVELAHGVITHPEHNRYKNNSSLRA